MYLNPLLPLLPR